MKPITTSQIGAFNGLLKLHGLTNDKAAIVKEMSNGRANSTKDLYFEEIQPWLNKMFAIKKNELEEKDPKEKMIKHIIAMAREMGVIRRIQQVNAKGVMEWKSDYSAFNEWMLTKSTGKKKLNDYTYAELTILVTQYKAIYHSWLKKFH